METKLLYLLTQNSPFDAPVARVSISTPQLISTTLAPTWNATTFATNGMTVGSTTIEVPLQGYYLVQTCITFSSVNTGTYSGPTTGSFGRADITINNIVQTLGSAVAQSTANSEYTSVANDILFLAQSSQIGVLISASSGSNIYAWSNTDTYSSFLSVSFLCD